jgi:hypothetical protein
VVPLIVLTFPAGIIGYMAFGVLYDHFGTTWGWDGASSGIAHWSYLGVCWSLIVACGYIQWFALLPWAARRWDRLART